MDPSRQAAYREGSQALQRDRDEWAAKAKEQLERANDLVFQTCELREINAKLSREQLPLPVNLTEAGWSSEAKTALIDFLRSYGGKALMARARHIQHQLLVGVAGSSYVPNPTAARHWCECLDWIESLSRASARSTEAPPTSADNSSETDTPSPGETMLRERLSP